MTERRMKKTYGRALKRRRQRRRRRVLWLAALAAAVLLVMGLSRSIGYVRTLFETGGRSETMKVDDSNLDEALRTRAREDGRYQTLIDHQEDYPESLLEMAARNSETLDFVLDYPKNKDNAPQSSVGSVTAGQIPLLLQWDERWGYSTYGDDLLAVTGCGPTVLSMVVSGLTGDSSITPYVVARYAQENGYYVSGTGTSWSLMSKGCSYFGLTADELSLSEASVFNALDSGCPIICSVRPGDFTTTGHFIVIYGKENGQLKIHDPNSKANSEQLWDYDRVAAQINNLWAYHLS